MTRACLFMNELEEKTVARPPMEYSRLIGSCQVLWYGRTAAGIDAH